MNPPLDCRRAAELTLIARSESLTLVPIRVNSWLEKLLQSLNPINPDNLVNPV